MRDEINITRADMLQSVNESEETISDTVVADDFLEIFQWRMMYSFMALLHEIAKEREANASDSNGKQHLWSPMYASWYILTLRDMDVGKMDQRTTNAYKHCVESFLLAALGTPENEGTALRWRVAVERKNIDCELVRHYPYFIERSCR